MDTNARKRCQDEVQRYTAKLAQIRADKTLSDLGRRQAIANAYDQTMTAVSKVKTEQAKAREAQRNNLARRLFGLSPAASTAEVVAHRDAADRVAKVQTPEALGELMQTAHDSGDRQLLKAAAAHAFARSSSVGGQHYGLLVDEYAEQTATGPDLEQYRAILSTASAQATLVESLQTTPPRPAELSDRSVPSDVQPRTVGAGFSTSGHVPGSFDPSPAA